MGGISIKIDKDPYLRTLFANKELGFSRRKALQVLDS